MSPYGPDITPPTTTHDYDGSWCTTDFTITLAATDDKSGVAETYYKINGGETKNLTAHGQPNFATESAGNALEYWSIDNADNEELPHKMLTGIKLDKAAPSGSIVINNGDASTTSTSVTLTLTYSDATSGVYQVRYSNDGSSWSSWESASATKAWTLTSGDGTKTVYYQIRDAGLLSSTYSDTISLQSPSPTPTPSPSPTQSPEPTPTPTPSPTPSPSPTPPPDETPWGPTIIAAVGIFILIGAGLFLLKRK
jgi:hypothetical protein